MRTYEEMIMEYGTAEEREELFGEDGQEYVREMQRERAYNKLSPEQKYEVDCGCASIDDYLTDNDMNYWRRAGAMAARDFFGDCSWDEDEEWDEE